MSKQIELTVFTGRERLKDFISKADNLTYDDTFGGNPGYGGSPGGNPFPPPDYCPDCLPECADDPPPDDDCLTTGQTGDMCLDWDRSVLNRSWHAENNDGIINFSEQFPADPIRAYWYNGAIVHPIDDKEGRSYYSYKVTASQVDVTTTIFRDEQVGEPNDCPVLWEIRSGNWGDGEPEWDAGGGVISSGTLDPEEDSRDITFTCLAVGQYIQFWTKNISTTGQGQNEGTPCLDRGTAAGAQVALSRWALENTTLCFRDACWQENGQTDPEPCQCAEEQPVFGGYGDGSTTIFNTTWAYKPGSLRVEVDGISTAVTEINATEFEFAVAPVEDAQIDAYYAAEPCGDCVGETVPNWDDAQDLSGMTLTQGDLSGTLFDLPALGANDSFTESVGTGVLFCPEIDITSATRIAGYFEAFGDYGNTYIDNSPAEDDARYYQFGVAFGNSGPSVFFVYIDEDPNYATGWWMYFWDGNDYEFVPASLPLTFEFIHEANSGTATIRACGQEISDAVWESTTHSMTFSVYQDTIDSDYLTYDPSHINVTLTAIEPRNDVSVDCPPPPSAGANQEMATYSNGQWVTSNATASNLDSVWFDDLPAIRNVHYTILGNTITPMAALLPGTKVRVRYV